MNYRKDTDGGLAGIPNSWEVKRLIECPVCFEIPSPPIFTCKTGHAICKDCKPKLKNCALCENIFTDTRNFALESMILAAKFFCSNRRGGCKTEGTIEELNKHHLICPLRKLKCHIFGSSKCNYSKVFIQDFYDHLKTTHSCYTLMPSLKTKNTFVDNRYLRKQPKSSTSYWKPDVMIFDGKYFIVQWSKTVSIMNCGIYVIEDDACKTSYRVKISIRAPGNDVDSSQVPHFEMSMIVPSIREIEKHPVVHDVVVSVPFLKKLGGEDSDKKSDYLRWTAEYTLYKFS